jgi:hypothetical protein
MVVEEELFKLHYWRHEACFEQLSSNSVLSTFFHCISFTVVVVMIQSQ